MHSSAKMIMQHSFMCLCCKKVLHFSDSPIRTSAIHGFECACFRVRVWTGGWDPNKQTDRDDERERRTPRGNSWRLWIGGGICLKQSPLYRFTQAMLAVMRFGLPLTLNCISFSAPQSTSLFLSPSLFLLHLISRGETAQLPLWCHSRPMRPDRFQLSWKM